MRKASVDSFPLLSSGEDSELDNEDGGGRLSKAVRCQMIVRRTRELTGLWTWLEPPFI